MSGMIASVVGLAALGALSAVPFVVLIVPLALLGYGFAVVLTTAADLVLMSAPTGGSGRRLPCPRRPSNSGRRWGSHCWAVC